MDNGLTLKAKPVKDFDFNVPTFRCKPAVQTYDLSCREASPDYFWPNIYLLFQEQKKASPYHLAVQDAHDQYAYVDLDERVNQIAAEIVHTGIEREDVIGICMPRSAELVATMLAVLKVGAAFVLFDDMASLSRQYRFMQESSATLFVGKASSNQTFSAYLSSMRLDQRYQFIAVDQIPRQPGRRPVTTVPLDNQLAHVTYRYDPTAGPMTLQYDHSALLDVMQVLREKLPVYRLRSMLSTSSVYQSSFVAELFFALTSGVTFNFLAEQDAANPFALNAVIKQTGADLLVAPVDVLNRLSHASTTISDTLVLLCLCDDMDQCVDEAIIQQVNGVFYYFNLGEPSLCAGVNQSSSDVPDDSAYDPSIGSRRLGQPRELARGCFSSEIISVPFIVVDGVRVGFDEVTYFLEQHPAVASAVVSCDQGKVSISIALSAWFGVTLGAELEVNARNLSNESEYPEINVENVSECLALSVRLNAYLMNNLVVSFHPDCYIFSS